MKYKGLKSVLFAGTGEPLLNKNAVDIINDTKVNTINIDILFRTF